jgi:hypothetical protein
MPTTPNPSPEPEINAHFVVELAGTHLQILRKALNMLSVTGTADVIAKREATDQLNCAELVLLPLSRERLGWSEVERAAMEQGCSVTDVLWDRMGNVYKEPRAPRRRDRRDS